MTWRVRTVGGWKGGWEKYGATGSQVFVALRESHTPCGGIELEFYLSSGGIYLSKKIKSAL